MRKDNKQKQIIEILLTVSLSTIVMLLGIYYLPLQFLIFLYGIPFVILGIKHDLNISIIGMIASTLVIGLLTDYISGISLLAVFLPLTVSLVYTIKNRKKPLEIIAISTIVLIISFFLVLGIMRNLTGVSIVNQIDEFFNQLLDMQMEFLGDTELSPSELFRFRDFMEDEIKEILLQIPATLMLISLILTYATYFISVLVLRKLGYGIVYTPRFSRFKLPDNILLGVGIMFLGTFILKSLNVSYYESAYINVNLLVSFAFLLQGFAVIDYKLRERKMNILLRLTIVLLLIILLPLGIYITFLGMLDSIFDFRKIRKPV